jgi:hypothetical protein
MAGAEVCVGSSTSRPGMAAELSRLPSIAAFRSVAPATSRGATMAAVAIARFAAPAPPSPVLCTIGSWRGDAAIKSTPAVIFRRPA